MKVLQIASGDYTSTYGGGQVYVRRLVRALLRISGVEVCVVSSFTGKEVEEVCVEGVPVYLMPQDDFKAAFKQTLDKISPAVVHSHGNKAQTAEVCKEMGIPCVVTAHHGGILCPAGALLNEKDKICTCSACHNDCLGCVLNNIRWGKWVRPIMKLLPQSLYLKVGKLLNKLPFMLFVTPVGQAACQIQNKLEEWRSICSNCDMMIAPSQAMADVMQRNGMDVNKITVLPHGVEIPDLAVDFPAVTEKKIKFYYVGRINYVKGVHVLVNAFMQVAAENIELHIIGGTGNMHELCYMNQLQSESSSDNRIIWHGKIPENEVSKQTLHYHILINPSICLETFGLNIAEALSAGKLVLSTRCGGAEMQIKEGENGWLVEPNSVDEIKETIETIVSNPPPCSPRYKGFISLEEHACRMLQVYKEVLIEKKGS